MITLHSCPMCDSADIDFLTDAGEKFDGERSNICMNCGLVFLSPRMDDNELEEYYLTDAFSTDFRGEEKRIDRGKFLRARARIRWDAISDHFPDGGNFLEVGCSSGEFLEFAMQKMVVYGVDPSTGYLNSIDVDDESFGGARIGVFPEESFADEVDKFDVIGLFHTLEHAPDPLGLLKSIHDKLVDDGLFFLEYPDVELAAQRESLPTTYFQRSHLYDFSGYNLVNWINEAGFRIFDVVIPNRNYPNDKNVIIAAMKAEPTDERVLYNDRALALRDRLRTAMKNHDPININTGANPRILHIGSHNINVGDGAITSGIMNGVSDVLQTTVDFVQLDIVDYLTTITAEIINDYKADMVIVGGGGTIDGHFGREETGTAFRLPPSEIEKIDAKMMFVGLGHNQFRQQEFFHADILSDFIAFCAAEDIPFSVRMDGSRERLQEIIDADVIKHIQKIPDPGFFVDISNTEQSPYFAPMRGVKNVVLQLASDGSSNRLGSEDEFTKFLDSIWEYFENTIVNHNAQFCIATHTYDDLVIPVHAAQKVNHKLLRSRTRVSGVYHPLFAENFFRAYSDADLVVGMRGHSVICGTALGTPTIAIATHDKVKGFMAEAGAITWSIDPTLPGFIGKLYEQTSELLSAPERQTNLVSEATKDWYTIFKSFLKEGLKKV